MNKDLTVGDPQRILWRYSLPLFGSVIFQQLYNIADSLVVGKFVGENALAAVGNSYEITLIYLAFAVGCNIGCSVIISQLFGAKKIWELKTAVSTALIASGVLCFALMIFGFFCTPALLKVIHTPTGIFADSLLYLKIYTAGLLFLFYYNIATGIFSALGDSKTPFYLLAVSSVSNVIVDYLFVTALGMGVDGVAWATFLCQGVSCILSLVILLKRIGKMPIEQRMVWFSYDILIKISRIAVPSILQQSFISIGNILIQSVINGFGPAVIAGYSAAIKLNNLVITSFTTLGNGMSSYISQNLGARKMDRISPGYRAGLKMVYIMSVPIIILYLTASKPLMLLFMDEGTGAAVQTGMQILRIIVPFYVVVATKLITDGVLRGAQAMRQFMTATFTDLILRVVLAFVFSRFFGSVGIWCAWPIGWSIATCMSVYFYRKPGVVRAQG
ncbi:MAG: MATE family efflux transporter [Anaerostipes sp.]|uniref:MATE family efflux transporter n=1 Tax=Anaerostipes sp. 992a TaxID=1261637 RepID=UPI0009513B0E|nr:MATE family efflux transporter [Anaerostipes sp. 992a]MCI5952702.1 MATE family efflux transporter [Anaerostipes sp.]OLR62961.1 MATE family efflux transporter [Anaerostipes sp. 992a]